MKRYITVFNTLILLLLISSKILNATCYINNAKYALSDNDWKFLHYFQFTNEFDSVSVTYTTGEFKISNGSNTITPYIKNLELNSNFWKMGDSVQGVDTVLLQYSGTDTFTYQSGSSISFFRMLEVIIPCENAPPDVGNGNPGGGKFRWLLFR